MLFFIDKATKPHEAHIPLVPSPRHVPRLEMPLLRLNKLTPQPHALSSVLDCEDEGRRLGSTTIHDTAIRESAMSRREPMNQIRWEDLKSIGILKEHSFVKAGPNSECVIDVYKVKRNDSYLLDCNLLKGGTKRLTATNMTDAKSEAVDIVRILLHNILSDL